MPLTYVKYGPEVWECEDPPDSGQWKLVPPDHQELCTSALEDGLHEVSGHDIEDTDPEWDYNFLNGTVRLYRGTLCRFTWSSRRIQPNKVKHRLRLKHARRCVHAARAIRRTVLRWVPRAMTTAIARKCRCAGHVEAEASPRSDKSSGGPTL